MRRHLFGGDRPFGPGCGGQRAIGHLAPQWRADAVAHHHDDALHPLARGRGGGRQERGGEGEQRDGPAGRGADRHGPSPHILRHFYVAPHFHIVIVRLNWKTRPVFMYPPARSGAM